MDRQRGHFKGLEIPIEYFMHLGWNTKQWTNRNITSIRTYGLPGVWRDPRAGDS